jgi:hypothetical protein
VSMDLILGSSCRAAPSSRLVCLLPAMVVSPIAYGGPLALPESERPAGPKQYGRGVHGLCIYQYRYVFIYIYICTCICIYIYKTRIRVINAWPGHAPPSPERVWWLPLPELRESQAGEFVWFYINQAGP